MRIYVTGLPSTYEIEHLTRLFYAEAAVSPTPVRKADVVRAAWGRKSLLCAVRVNGVCTIEKMPLPLLQKGEKADFVLATRLYALLRRVTGIRPPWGLLTGVRPVRLVHDMAFKGLADAEIENVFRQKYDVSEEKLSLAMRTAQNQRSVLAGNTPRSYSLYISIPFCPSRCSYCSFVSRTTAQSADIMAPYVERLCTELQEIAATAQRNNLRLRTIYIGGGTPTAISAPLLQQLMHCVRETFPLQTLEEYTVEAGRPDCTTSEKLGIIKEYGATRISINPQTLSDEVLAAIGRKHTAQDIVDCYHEARRLGHTNINMDLIAGLPKDTVQGFAASLRGVMALGPENITVHTLTLKRASNIVIEHRESDYDDVQKMLAYRGELEAAGWQPYYLYRQKKTLGNLENTGYTKPGFACLYNIYIMEEVHTILAAGAGASTKLVAPRGKDGRLHIQRIYNQKYPAEYLQRFDEEMAKQKEVDAFYGSYLDTETAR